MQVEELGEICATWDEIAETAMRNASGEVAVAANSISRLVLAELTMGIKVGNTEDLGTMLLNQAKAIAALSLAMHHLRVETQARTQP